MLVAKIEGGNVVEVKDYREMFPNVSFPRTGPDAAFMEENGLVLVYVSRPYDDQAYRMVPCEPYLEDGVVYTVDVEPLPPEVIAATAAGRRAALIESFTNEAQAHIDAFAKARGYGSILSACSYTSSSVPRYAADALHAIAKRDAWWVALNQIMNDVIAGNRAEPTSFEQILPDLPELTWPN